MIDHLPRHSALIEAQATDREVAEAWMRTKDADEDRPVEERFSEWDPIRTALADISDQLQSLTRAVVLGNGGHPGRFSPTSRPKSALQRVKEERRIADHRQLVDRVLARRR